MRIVLIGYMGSGKSLIGEALSKVLHFPFIDLDAEIERRENASISEIFQNKGVIYFRRKEAEILFDLLQTIPDVVIATGGGTPCYGTVMDQLKALELVKTIYLKHQITTLSTRLFKERTHRPLIAHIPNEALLEEFIGKHLFERSFYYNQADLIIDGDQLTPAELVEKIVIVLF